MLRISVLGEPIHNILQVDTLAEAVGLHRRAALGRSTVSVHGWDVRLLWIFVQGRWAVERCFGLVAPDGPQVCLYLLIFFQVLCGCDLSVASSAGLALERSRQPRTLIPLHCTAGALLPWRWLGGAVRLLVRAPAALHELYKGKVHCSP